MSYSRRQLYAFGETLGECVTRKEGGRIIYGSGDGGGGGGAAQQTTVSDLPEWAKPYAQQTLAKTQELTDVGQNKYPTYTGERIQGLDPLQQQIYKDVGSMQTAPQLDVASNVAQSAALRGLGTGYQAGQFGNQFQAPGAYQPATFDYIQAQAPELQQYQMGPAERVGTGSFTQPGAAAQYMSPFIEQALVPQLREAQRTSDILGTQQAGQAVQQGAFGGSRAGLLEAERQRNLATQMGDIRSKGLQTAFEQAQQLYGTEAQRQLAAQQANQAAGLTVGGQNLAAQLGIQQLGAGQSLQAQLANQQARQQAQAQREASRQFGYGQRMQAAGLGAQYGLAGQQLGEQSRQYGAGLGLQGLQTALSGAGQLGQLGQQQFGQQKDIYGLQNQFGQQQRDYQQQLLSQQYQDFLNQQRYPYQQLEFMSNILRGTPMGTVQSMYQAQPSQMSQLAGLGVAGAGAYGLMNRKKGGAIKEKKPAGLAELALAKMGE